MAMPTMAKASMPQSRKRDVHWRAFERRHGDLVEDGFARKWIHVRNQLEFRRVSQEPRFDVVSAISLVAKPSPGYLSSASISSFGSDIWRVKKTPFPSDGSLCVPSQTTCERESTQLAPLWRGLILPVESIGLCVLQRHFDQRRSFTFHSRP